MFESIDLGRSSVDAPKTFSVPEGARAKVSVSFGKRFFDIVLAAVTLLFFSPFFVLVAILIKSDSRGPVFFLQKRTGVNGRAFSIYKFRSMHVSETGTTVVQAKVNDKRVTRVGRVLRKTSMDEIPQLINILRGEMSFVGPRPHAMSHDIEFALNTPNYNQRFRTRPGLTGLAQIRGFRGEVSCVQDVHGRVASDIEYIETWALWKDFAIILRTVPLVFGDKRAY